MAWGDYGASHRLRLQNSVTAWGVGGTPFNVAIQQTGILERLRLITAGTSTITHGTGTNALDELGPWNQYSFLFLSPNKQSPIFSCSGIGAFLINQLISLEFQPQTSDTTIVSSSRMPTPATDRYSFNSTAGSGQTYRNSFLVPVAQKIRSLGGYIGYWPLQNPAVQLGIDITPNTASSASPFNIFSTQAGNSPVLITGNDTATLTTPTAELVRDMWEVPADPADLPEFNLVSSWIEEAPQGANVNGASIIQYQVSPLIGLLVRLGIFIFDGGTNAGVASSSLTASNALQISYDADTPKHQESAFDAAARQNWLYGFDLVQGFYAWDFLGADLTLQDTLDTNTIANIKLKVSLNVALGGSNSYAKILRQVIAPLEIR